MYKLTNKNVVVRLLDSASIPMVDDNTDYEEYLKWVAEGNITEPADVPEGE